jgi:hypothetical protein
MNKEMEDFLQSLIGTFNYDPDKAAVCLRALEAPALPINEPAT